MNEPGWPTINAIADRAENVSAGTQVVSLVEVRGTNNSLVHPRGAVGVVTRTPRGDEGRLLVRFPDGFEFSLLVRIRLSIPRCPVGCSTRRCHHRPII